MAVLSAADYLRFVLVNLRRESKTAYVGKENVALSPELGIMNNGAGLLGNFSGGL